MKYIMFTGLLWLTLATAYPQETAGVSHYVFPEFITGTVYKADGNKESVPLNYNTVTQEMIFSLNGKNLALAELASIDSVVIKGKSFIPAGERFFEKVNVATLALYIQHKSTVSLPGTSVGYGSTTQTSGATALSSLPSNNGGKAIYDLKLPDEFKVVPADEYWLKSGNSFIKANSQKQFLKAFPDKEKQIRQYISEKHANFTSLSSLKDMLIYISQ
ncbi:hypothetical protein GS399_08440 [Pedobacter sp. HMF7647]|uniref:DUF4369 domain-containing protein n=1 Tax=Hufsiella arboris TaxID=2695275 RepID=A0A7K1YA98_9SPHI|nr:hypothetical protein [Hufsiella arboris]MXV50998.1 hypothetical protein [Hufsiella arboris]